MKQQPWAKKNRVASALRNEHVRVGEREGVGRGLFATRAFAPGDAITAYTGRLVQQSELVRLFETDKAEFDRLSDYMIATPNGGHLAPVDVAAVGGHLVNHACGPNARFAEWERDALVVRAVTPIAEGEEITAHYSWIGIKAAKERSWHPCKCVAPCCVGTIELRVEWVPDEEAPDGTVSGSLYLPEEEVAMRFLADIINDTDENEAVMRSYSRNAHRVAPGANFTQGVDPEAFFEKLSAGAEAAVYTALRTPVGAKRRSDRRLRQVMMRYGARGQE